MKLSFQWLVEGSQGPGPHGHGGVVGYRALGSVNRRVSSGVPLTLVAPMAQSSAPARVSERDPTGPVWLCRGPSCALQHPSRGGRHPRPRPLTVGPLNR